MDRKFKNTFLTGNQQVFTIKKKKGVFFARLTLWNLQRQWYVFTILPGYTFWLITILPILNTEAPLLHFFATCFRSKPPFNNYLRHPYSLEPPIVSPTRPYALYYPFVPRLALPTSPITPLPLYPLLLPLPPSALPACPLPPLRPTCRLLDVQFFFQFF